MSGDRDSSAWLAKWRSGRMTAAEQRRFAQWLDDPAHRADFDALNAAFGRLDDIAEDPAIRAAREAALQRAKAPRQRQFMPMAAGVVAAMLAALLLFAMPGFVGGDAPPSEQLWATVDNQRKQITLEDGSRIVLDANSQVAVRYGPTERQIFLRGGRAFFEVAKDRTRPFIVTTAMGSVRALGTAFSVDGRRDGIKILLTEGKVRVRLDKSGPAAAGRPIDMVEGTELAANARGWSVRPKPADHALAWIEGYIVFDDTPLRDAVAEFNASSRRAIEIEPGLDGQRISGTFRSGRAGDFSRALQSYGIARIESEDQQKIVLAMPIENKSQP
uniref:FecR family protein n=1 Tax=Edaphosphingomonas laterariae TaxID=861865 RepID=UPI0015C6559F|nr:FecR domain-containing protein [Sphingomonas laterariae]